MRTRSFLLALGLISGLMGTGCASAPAVPMSRERYARLSNERFFNSDVITVWKSVARVTENYRITQREIDGSTARALKTDWIYTRSRDKHDSIRIHGEVKTLPLQSRIRFKIMAHGVLGGTEVQVETSEEIEQLGTDGRSQGYRAVADADKDTSRASDLLDKIGLALISPAP